MPLQHWHSKLHLPSPENQTSNLGRPLYVRLSVNLIEDQTKNQLFLSQQLQKLLLVPSESRPVVGVGVGGWGCSSHTFSSHGSFTGRVVGVGLLLEGGGLEGGATPPPPLPFALLGELRLYCIPFTPLSSTEVARPHQPTARQS